MAQWGQVTNIFDKTPIVVAETDAKHGGSLQRLLDYIDAISEAGADAVKFQIRVCDAEVAEDEQWRPGTEPESGETRAEYWRRIELDAPAWAYATAYAKKLGLIVGASVFSPEGVEVAVACKVDYLKIGSGHVFDDAIYDSAVDSGLPVVISGGMGLSLNKICNHLCLQCQSIYPTPDELCRRYGSVTSQGYSCHTGTIEPVNDAMSRGAKMVEVHVKLDRYQDDQWPDSSSSVTMEQLRQIVAHRDFIREAGNWTEEKQAECERLAEETRKAIHTGKRFK